MEKIIEPRLGQYKGDEGEPGSIEMEDTSLTEITSNERSGMRWAGIAVLIYLAVLAITIVPKNGILRGENGAIIESPFFSSMVPILTIFFLVAGLAYGIKTKVRCV